MDVTAAYLHGDIEEEIYVRPSKEIAKKADAGKVFRLRKSMYGLKQSGRAWKMKLHQTLTNMSFTRSQADPCVYFKREKNKLVIIVVYVDDLLILATDEKELTLLKRKLSQTFNIKDLGEAKHLLGMVITRNRGAGEIWLDQSTYVQKVLQRFGMDDCKPVSTPFDPNSKLSKDMEPKTSEEACEMKKKFRTARQ